jgi:hypothetical protein
VALVSFLLVVILLVGGANVAAAAALPGNWLYPLKLAQETARVWIVPDESERLRLRLAWADRRLEEAQTRLDQGRSHDTQQALQGYVHLMETSLKEISGEPGGATQSQVNQWMLQELERQRLQLIQIQEVAGPLASMHEVLYASQQIQERVEYQVRQQLHETPQQPASTTTNPGMVGTVEATSQTTKKAPTPMPDGQQIFRSPATGEPAKVSPGGLNYPVWTKTSPGQADATPVPYRTRQPVEVNPTRQLPTPDRGGANPPGDEHESQPSNPTGNRPDPSGDRPGSPEDRSGSQGDRASPGGRSPGQRR